MPTSELLINYVPGEECRIAILEDGKLEEYYQERASAESHVSNIYKGRVVNVEPAIQAAFIDFGLERNGFLHISDLHPKYFPGKDREEFEKVGHKTARHERPPIQKCLKRGQEVTVQVLKEGIGTKGPTLTSYLSIPGRFLVMMPDMQRLGVSRKVEDDDARKEMRDILKTLDPPKEFGFIIRTAGIGQTKTDLKRDLSYLQRLWKNMEQKRKKLRGVGELYAESDLVIRTIRDVFNNDIQRIVCDDLTAARRARDFLSVANPRTKSQVIYYDDPVPMFHRLGVESQIDNIGAREVPLPSGGALVIDQTEALVAVDVNSGKSRAARDSETNAYKTNCEAVDEIARQLRLRDLGGLVVLDLIDMRPMKNRKAVETRFRNNLKKDRARTRIGPISQFGLLELTRQRMRPSLKTSIYQECGHCIGRGYTMSPESVVLRVMRQLALVMHRKDVARIELTISPDVAFHILNRKRSELVALESKLGKAVMVRVGGKTVDFVNVAAYNAKDVLIAEGLDMAVPNLAGQDDRKGEAFRDLDDPSLPEASNEGTPEAWTPLDDDEDDADDTPTDTGEASAEGGSEAGEADSGEGKTKRRRRRRRGGRGRNRGNDEQNQDATSNADGGDDDRLDESEASDDPAPETVTAEASEDDADRDTDDAGNPDAAQEAAAEDTSSEDGSDGDDEKPAKPKRRRRRRRKSSANSEDQDHAAQGAAEAPSQDTPDSEPNSEPVASERPDGDAADDAEAPADKPKRKRRRRRSKKSDNPGDGGGSDREAPVVALDEHGDPNGNIKPEFVKSEAQGNTKKEATRPPLKPGRGYANRLVTPD